MTSVLSILHILPNCLKEEQASHQGISEVKVERLAVTQKGAGLIVDLPLF